MKVLQHASKLFLALFLSAIFLFPLLIIYLILRLTQRGSVFFKQKRVGLDGREFDIYKFKTMRDLPAFNEVWDRFSDAQRTTRIGKILRASHLDELPQVFNIICGDMNFVGPRPEMADNVETMRKELPQYDLRHKVPPGLTGLAQVKHGYSVSKEDVAEKLKYDIEYVEKRSPLLDAKIVLWTFSRVVKDIRSKR